MYSYNQFYFVDTTSNGILDDISKCRSIFVDRSLGLRGPTRRSAIIDTYKRTAVHELSHDTTRCSRPFDAHHYCTFSISIDDSTLRSVDSIFSHNLPPSQPLVPLASLPPVLSCITIPRAH